jgi:RNA polymerase sigma factor (sigma-70 family)
VSPLLSIRFLARKPDAQLVAMIHQGSDRAFEILVERYRRQLVAYARRMLGSDARAEDAVQQALLQAWVALRAGARPDDLRPWLFRIVHNAAIVSIRRRHLPCVALDEALDAAGQGDGVETRMAVREALAELAALPDLQRRAIVLTAFGGSSHGEVAATLGVSDGAVRGLIYRARAALRSAAAAVLPTPMAAWMMGRAGRRTSVSDRVAEVLAGAGSAGGAGVIAKAGAIAATAGALATAGEVLVAPVVPSASPARHLRIAEVRERSGDRVGGPSAGPRSGAVAVGSRAGVPSLAVRAVRASRTGSVGLASAPVRAARGDRSKDPASRSGQPIRRGSGTSSSSGPGSAPGRSSGGGSNQGPSAGGGSTSGGGPGPSQQGGGPGPSPQGGGGTAAPTAGSPLTTSSPTATAPIAQMDAVSSGDGDHRSSGSTDGGGTTDGGGLTSGGGSGSGTDGGGSTSGKDGGGLDGGVSGSSGGT